MPIRFIVKSLFIVCVHEEFTSRITARRTEPAANATGPTRNIGAFIANGSTEVFESLSVD